MQSGALIGIATRYIAGRNAVQTVYWRSINTGDGSTAKMIKVSKTFAYDRPTKTIKSTKKRES